MYAGVPNVEPASNGSGDEWNPIVVGNAENRPA